MDSKLVKEETLLKNREDSKLFSVTLFEEEDGFVYTATQRLHQARTKQSLMETKTPNKLKPSH